MQIDVAQTKTAYNIEAVLNPLSSEQLKSALSEQHEVLFCTNLTSSSGILFNH
jgi:hypothetical protein